MATRRLPGDYEDVLHMQTKSFKGVRNTAVVERIEP